MSTKSTSKKTETKIKYQFDFSSIPDFFKDGNQERQNGNNVTN